MLYQLNYSHHRRAERPVDTSRYRLRCPNRFSAFAVQFGHSVGDLAGRRSRWRDERGAPVVLELADRFLDVGQRAVREALLRLAVVDPRIPAPAQLLDRADVDHPVVQEVVELGHVPRDEAAVGGDRVAGQRRGLGRVDVGADVVEHHLLGAAATSTVEARTSSVRPERLCIWATTSTIPSSASSSAWITTSMPSPRTLSSASVTRAAISMSRSDRRSRPVISQSIHTNSSRTALNSIPSPTQQSSTHPVAAGSHGKDRAAMTSESTATPAQQIAAGYATDRAGARTRLGRRRRCGGSRSAGPHSAGHDEPARPGRRRHRYRQDQDRCR